MNTYGVRIKLVNSPCVLVSVRYILVAFMNTYGVRIKLVNRGHTDLGAV
jgi:hypothetical protein